MKGVDGVATNQHPRMPEKRGGAKGGKEGNRGVVGANLIGVRRGLDGWMDRWMGYVRVLWACAVALEEKI